MSRIEYTPRLIFALIACILSTVAICHAWSALVHPIFLPDADYAPALIQQIENSTSSITVNMYLAMLTPETRPILDSLIAAHDRGVTVSVTLENSKPENQPVFDYLANHNIPVTYDSPDTRLHAKTITFDDTRAMIGSHNWTTPALTTNHEASVFFTLPCKIETGPDYHPTTLLLPGTYYFHTLLSDIQCATSTSTIHFIMYSFNFFPDFGHEHTAPNILANALSSAREHGATVKGILELRGNPATARNAPASQFLSTAGADVTYDNPGITTHAKLVTIDGSRTYIGSHNWTEPALETNIEESVLVISTYVAIQAVQYFRHLREESADYMKQTTAQDVSTRMPAFIHIPYAELQPKERGALWQLRRCKAGKAMQCYLYLLYQAAHTSSSIINIKYADLANALGYYWQPEIAARTTYRDRAHYYRLNVVSLLKILKRKRIIQFMPTPGDSRSVTITIPGLSEQEASLPSFAFPAEYFLYNWTSRLTAAEAYFYLINWAEYTKSSTKPVWYDSYPNIAKRYGISANTLHRTVKSLHRWNLIEVKHDIPEPGQKFSERCANRYIVNVPWSEHDLDAHWEKLEQQYGAEKLNFARGMAEKINEPYDQHVVLSLVWWAEEYGEDAVARAIRKATALSFSNGKWELRYIHGILEGDTR